jgi:hypothetical protein
MDPGFRRDDGDGVRRPRLLLRMFCGQALASPG